MYNDSHRYFVQYMLNNSYVPIDNALEFCKTNLEEMETVDALKTFTTEINEVITKHKLKLSILKCEVTGNVKLALLNTGNDDISKLQNNFTTAEIEYFQLLLKEIIISDDHKIQNMACFNLSNNSIGTLRKDAIEKLLKKLIIGGYLVEKATYIYLGPRCIAEFAPYFQTHCKDYYSSCHLCSEIVFTGRCCTACEKTMHDHCLERYLKKQNKCPNCKALWNEAGTSASDSQE